MRDGSMMSSTPFTSTCPVAANIAAENPITASASMRPCPIGYLYTFVRDDTRSVMNRIEPERRSRIESRKEAKTASEPERTSARSLRTVSATLTPKLTQTMSFSCCLTSTRVSAGRKRTYKTRTARVRQFAVVVALVVLSQSLLIGLDLLLHLRST